MGEVLCFLPRGNTPEWTGEFYQAHSIKKEWRETHSEYDGKGEKWGTSKEGQFWLQRVL